MRATDEPLPPVEVRGSPTHLSCDDRRVGVSNADPHESDVCVLSVATREVVTEAQIPGGSPLGSAITPDGNHALVGTATGKLARVDLATGVVEDVDIAGRIVSVDVLPDGSAAFAADASGRVVHRVGLPDLTIETAIPLSEPPLVVRVAPDGQVWVLCRPDTDDAGRLIQIDPASNAISRDWALPFRGPHDMAIVPVAGQSPDEVRTAWITYDGDRFSQFNIGGPFAGDVHSIHKGSMTEGLTAPNAIAVNDYGEIWMARPDLDHVWKWPGGRLICRADDTRPLNGAFYGEYLDVAVYGALRD